MANSTSNLNLLSSSQSAKEIAANALFDAGSPATLYGRNANTCNGLIWGFYGGYANTTNGLTSVSNNTVTLANGATNYLEANPTTGAVTVNSTGFTAGRTPLYQIVTSGGAVTSYTDMRITSHRIFRIATKSVAGATDVTLNQSEASNELLTVSGAITANINVILPTVPFVWNVFNNTSGAFTVTFKTAAGTGITVAQTKRAIIACDGTNIVRFSSDI